MDRRIPLVVVLLGGVAVTAAKADKSAEFFKSGPIPRFTITLEDDELKKIRKNDREPVRCTVREGSREYPDVSVHLKGAAGSFRSFDDKPALTLKFDKHDKDQRYRGLDKLHLNNSVQDASYLCEILCSELFLAADVPTARATHAIVELQGKKRGLYVLKEGYDEAFLKRQFGSAKGNLYDGGFLTDIDTPIKKSSGKDEQDHSDLQALAAACKERDRAQRLARIEKVLDLDRFISMMAVEVMTWHWDGYGMKANNYRIYHDPKSEKLVFIPHGMDQMFEEPHGGIAPPMGGVVAHALFEIPEMRKRYYRRLGELSAKNFAAEKMLRRIDEIHERLRPAAEEVGSGFARRHGRQVEELKNRVRERAEFVEKQIKAKLESIKD
jgi:spore coat protein CotH